MNKSVLGCFLIPGLAFGSDPFTSVQQATRIEKSELSAFTSDHTKEKVTYFKYMESDPALGSVSVGVSGGEKAIKFNAVNYSLWLGGKYYLPMQVSFAGTSAGSGAATSSGDSNEAKITDQDLGDVSMRFPIFWTYQSAGDGLCAFLKSDIGYGHCSIGGDVSFSYRNMTDAAGDAKDSVGKAVRIGAASVFPVLSEDKSKSEGYMALAIRAAYFDSGIKEGTAFFTPVLDSGGNPIDFKESFWASDVEVKFAFFDKMAIVARWVKPFRNEEYISDNFSLEIENKF